MLIVICPGVHPPDLTASFVQALDWPAEPLVLTERLPIYSPPHILTFLLQQIPPSQRQTPILLIGFSAGVVGAIGAAYLWQILGGRIMALIAIDGWGVPLFSPFPIHRISHDAFTHWSSALLGAGQASFYAEPAVAHLELWRAPQTVCGWSVQSFAPRYHRITAAQFLHDLLQHYQINA
ncbi:hypothetical protein HJG54_02675 [Leptolyngbya sp. NK1-12]|uniref:Alpha/beta hydrolase n=1 Tax=Leptolyngbya sp. NK1-12 TaxID=2547451 RepID=A0AA96WB59_9CYAN|nr:hypothetical protein [Leptolyngbya sp. NK1-12]WNZ21879.1 hypothetical protein HJG54_02675 [Leptolyngbya sp. NK1-12]